MLKALELRDFAIVDELRLELAPGLNALTGETGAGKSLLVDALALLVGGRADSNLVRSGAAWALVQGEFDAPSLESASRKLQAEGRSQARIDGELVTIAELADRVGVAVAIHGQHAAQALSAREEPRRRLDRLLEPAQRESADRYRESYREFRQAREELTRLLDGARERERRLDTLRFEIGEIDAAALQAGEEETLRATARALRNADRIVHGATNALAAVSDQEASAVALLALAARELDSAARHHPPLEALARELHEARASVQATAGEIDGFLADFDLEPGQLERVESRLAKLDGLERKYGEGTGSILEYRERAAAELDALENADSETEELRGRLVRLESELQTLGGEVAAARAVAARKLEAGVVELLGQLGMPGARFEVELEELTQPGPSGLERVRFLFGANPGEPLGDLAGTGSGGELSRVMLALDVITGSDRPILVFDEVDAGVGGKAAREVGRLLKRLSGRHQVLVVTHLPQVAAFADAQYFVEKRSKDDRTVTRVHRLEPHEREQELARMLSGSVTDASLRNARELVADAVSG